MFRILESQAPAKQTATDTINTLSSRLQSVTLLEDRRAAILGLRSFAKIYPASVASESLRPLISSLRNDQEDVDTVKVILETLLNLFSPDENSPEASDEIALWLADEFTQRQDNITTLLDLLETNDFYSRLYSLQLISLISSARPERTQECIFTAPLGIPRLVSTLNDVREPVRNEALVLLIALTPSSEELQKLVAFENAFETVFSLIEAEGALTHGSEVVEDCLALLANLLKLNISNQSYFRETGCVKRLAKLLADVNQEQDPDGPSPWILAHRDKNIWGTLAIIQLFLAKGGVNTPANQMVFWHNGVMEQVLNLAFGQRFTVNITSKALATCADLIRGNPGLQEQFGDVEVLWGSEPTSERTPNGEVMANGFQRINVIEALLKLSLEPASIQQLDARLAACECIKAFFANHSGIRQHVLRRAIDGHLSGQDEIPNILSVLLTPPESRGNADLYQAWMASVLMFHLIFEDPEAKSIAMKVTEGDAESGEEVITCVQTIVGHLITGMQRGDDERISVGYLMLLCGWLFEDPDVVNDFLGEGSSIQTLLQETKLRGVSNVLVPGLSTILLGIIYEFSSKDSPIPRETLHKLLMEQMGRDPYIDKITRFRESPLVRDFEVLPQTVGATQHDGGLPDIFFDRTFIDFLKDNFSRLLRAIDREPGLEISVISNGVQRGISREMVDSLRSELEDRNQAVQKLEADLLSLKQKLEQEQSELMKAMDSNSVETSRIKQINEALQRNHEQELRRLEEQHHQAKNGLLKQHGDQLRALGSQLKETSADREKRGQQYEAEIAELQETINLLESDITRSKEQQTSESARLQKIIQSLESGLSQSREQQASEVDRLEKTIQSLGADLSQAREQAGEVANLQKTIQSLESDLVSAQEQHAGEVADLRGTIEKLASDTGQVKEQHATGLADKDKAIQGLQSDMEALKKQHEKEVADQKATIDSLQTDLDKAKDKSTNDTKAIHDEYSAKLSALEKRSEEAERKAEETEANAKKQAEEASQKSESADADAKKNAKELKDLRAELDKAKSQIKNAEKKGGSANADAKKTAKELESLRTELDKAKSQITEAEQKGGSDAKKTAKELQDLRAELDKAKSQIKEAEQKGGTADADAEKTAKELESLRSELDRAKSQLKEAEQMGEDADADAKKNVQELKDLRVQLEKANSQIKEAEEASDSSQSELDKAKSEAKEKEDARKAAQSELEDLLIVFGDLEAKREQDKKRLKDLGQEVSEAEDEDDDDEEEGDDE